MYVADAAASRTFVGFIRKAYELLMYQYVSHLPIVLQLPVNDSVSRNRDIGTTTFDRMNPRR